MRKALTTLYLFLFILIIGCSNNNEFEELNAKEFNTVVVSLNGSQIYKSNNNDVIEGIVNEININRKEFATEMSFSNEPEGKIKFTGENEVKVSFFEDTGRSIYGNYYIHTEFKFD
ncbi:hypothetical protein [Bacillus dakarensis]|uniref:hypothetical protein n=1 Tax=Robertmurraya dakarensis TaxID=1926278 RepID=UPI0009809EFD|nr:hypothetical protein [Bacillus dakarensis]